MLWAERLEDRGVAASTPAFGCGGNRRKCSPSPGRESSGRFSGPERRRGPPRTLQWGEQIANRAGRDGCGLNAVRARADTHRVNPVESHHSSHDSVRVSEVLAAMSFALDLTEGQPMGH